MLEMSWKRIATKAISFSIYNVNTQVCRPSDTDNRGDIVAVGCARQNNCYQSGKGGEGSKRDRKSIRDPERHPIVGVDILVSREGDIGET